MTSSVLTNLELRLRNSHGGDSVSFAHFESAAGVDVSINGEVFSMRVATKTTVAPPGEPAGHGITVLAGACGDGSMLIAVNCGQEPPTLNVSTRTAPGAVRSWSWEITHDIQHRILDVFSDCG